jgi:transcriptional regulator with PAS, ATPase and Fis domain
MGKKMKRISPEVFSAFEAYHWPGNVRELENVLERIVAIEDRETVTTDSLPREIMAPHGKIETQFLVQPGFNLAEQLDDITKCYVGQAIMAAGGNMKEVASLLGISYRSLRYLINKYDLKSRRKDDQRRGRNVFKALR